MLIIGQNQKRELIRYQHGSRVELEPGVEEVHGAKLSEGAQAEVEEIDDVDGQHRDEVKLRNKIKLILLLILRILRFLENILNQ